MSLESQYKQLIGKAAAAILSAAAASLLFFLFFIVSCSSSGSEGSSESDGNGTSDGSVAAEYVKAIGKSGGSLSVSDRESGIAGAEIRIPVDSLPEQTTFAITESDLPAPLPSGIRQAGPCVSFYPHGQKFIRKASIYLPYKDSDSNGIIDGTDILEKKASVFYFNAENNRWEKQVTGYRSLSSNRTGIRTDHLSTFIVAVDETATGPEDEDGTESAALQPGEYFTGDPEYKYQNGQRVLSPVGCIDNPDTRCGQSWNVSVIYGADTGIRAVLDRFTTMTGGYDITISDDYKSVSIDVFEYFEKVRLSGDAALWTWRVQFEKDHTKLRKYRVLDDSSIEAETVTGEKIYASIEVVDNRTVKIGWTINADQEMIPGDMIVVIFEAVYNG